MRNFFVLVVLLFGVSSTSAQQLSGGNLFPAGAAATPGIGIGIAGTGLYSVSTTSLGFSINGVSLMTLNSAGALSVPFSNITAGGALVSGSFIQIAANSSLLWNNRTVIASPADSQLKVTNNAGSTTLFDFGATTASAFSIPSLTSDAGKTDTSVCQDTTNHSFYSGSGTLGVCLGTSSVRYKKNIVAQIDGLAQIEALEPVNYRYINGRGDNGAREQYGFLAEDVISVLPKLVALDGNNEPNSVDILGMVPVLVKAVQQLKARNDELRADVEMLRRHDAMFTRTSIAQ